MYDAAQTFGHAMAIGAAKSVSFKNKKHLVLDLKIVYKKCGKEDHYGREYPQNQPVQSSQPSANSRLVKRTIIKKVSVSRSGQVNFTKAEEIL